MSGAVQYVPSERPWWGHLLTEEIMADFQAKVWAELQKYRTEDNVKILEGTEGVISDALQEAFKAAWPEVK